MNRKCVSLFLIAIILINDIVLSAYHWRISDDGKKIEAVNDSPYELRTTGSLTDFLKQVDNVRVVGGHVAELHKMLNKISMHEKIDNPKYEEEFRKQEEACVMSKGINLEPESFHTSFSGELCPEFHESYQRYTAFVKEYFGSPPDTAKRPPRCNYWFEAVKIKGISNVDLSKIMIPDRTTAEDELYLKILESYFPNFAKLSNGSEDFRKYGHMLASMLQHSDARISKNTYLHMAAAAYWRAQGRLLDAFVCYKTGAQFIDQNSMVELQSPYAENALKLSLSTLLNRAGHSVEAYRILKELGKIDQSPCFTAMTFAAAGDASVLTGSEEPSSELSEKPTIQLKLTKKERNGVFSRTFESFAIAAHHFKAAKKQYKQEDNGLFDQFFELDESKAYVLSCHMRLYEALEKQKENLEQLVEEKNNFQEIFNKRLESSERVRELMVASDVRTYNKLFYDLIKYGPHPQRKCAPMVINKNPNSSSGWNVANMMICRLQSPQDVYEKSMEEVRKNTVVNRMQNNESTWRVTEVYARSRTYEKTLMDIAKKSKQSDDYFNMITAKYTEKLQDDSEKPWRRADWPNSVDCQAVVSSSNPFRINTFPQVFISPENRGWIVSELLTKHLNVEGNEALQMPWFEPRCDFVMRNDLLVFSGFEAIERLLNPRFDRKNEKIAETMLKSTLVRLADKVVDESEIGARIHLLLKHGIGPKWVAMNLAGLYWRVQGNAHQAAKCLLGAFLDKPEESFIAIVQLSQVILRATGMVSDAHGFLMQQLNMLAYKEPLFHYVQGRMKLLMHDVDKAIQHLKDALDREPSDQRIGEDLLKIACSGKSTKTAISSQFPTVCCSPIVQNAVCIRPKKDGKEQCYVVDSTDSRFVAPQLIYHRCNGVYDGHSKKTSDYANIVSPFLLVFNTVTRRDDVSNWVDQVDGIQIVDSDELPLDYGGTAAFFAERPVEWWENSKNEMGYTLPMKEEMNDEWEEYHESDLAEIPPKPLSFLWIREKALMMQYDAQLPSLLPNPPLHQIRRGISIFPPPRLATMSCNGVAKLEAVFDNAPSTWVSVTAKGEDIEKYVDLRSPIPSMASLQPICPSMDKYDNSPLLGLDHIPAFALSDQFLFYKPEKALAEALKALGNERDTIEHIAARLHTAMLHNSSKDEQVNWLLCVLSSLYWRVSGHAENAMNCLRCALHTAPPHMRDVALVSLANICHQAGLLNSALISAGAALSSSPRLVAIHFTLANIYASIGDYQRALNFYYSTLSLQSNFLPAKDRIRSIYCHSGQEFNF